MGLCRQGGIHRSGGLGHFHGESGGVGIFQTAELGLILSLKFLRQVQSGGDVILGGAVESRSDCLRNCSRSWSALTACVMLVVLPLCSACTKPLSAAKALLAVGLSLESC